MCNLLCLQAMESKLLSGGNIVDHTNEQQRALEQRKKEIADQRVGSDEKITQTDTHTHIHIYRHAFQLIN